MNELKITNLSKTYPNGVKALDDISLTITNGMFGLLGPNGAGKSSLMRTIATLQEPSKGSLSFNGTDILKEPQIIRAQLGYLPQEFGVYPKISAYKLLDHIAILKGILNNKDRKEQVEALLIQTNLYAQRKKSVSNFSGGMRQRFGIAQALLGDPKLVIVDEPTAGLDPEERNRFHNLLSDIATNMIVILSTHIVEDVRDLCTHMAIMGDGQLLTQGIPSQLMDELKGNIWHRTINKKDLPAFQKAFKVIATRLFSGKTQIRVLSDHCPERGFEMVDPDLEDVYFTTLINRQPVTH
ncbi:ABC transporter ATP-binding protein [Fulvivirgaceae bacterium BMA10]|uniref:ABC transporter ATP-binding protein n=1 Tax=Splendidivirga corallicola TaxID=3051826 RepID=A0ABT8KNA6_9BACT|nr:ABC transporter ATP-binding protein [Fulvivirgaceae bacterium BMA10]